MTIGNRIALGFFILLVILSVTKKQWFNCITQHTTTQSTSVTYIPL